MCHSDCVVAEDGTKSVLNNFVKKQEEITLLIYSNSKDAVKDAVDDVEKMWKDRIATLRLRDKGSIKKFSPQMVNSNVTLVLT